MEVIAVGCNRRAVGNWASNDWLFSNENTAEPRGDEQQKLFLY
jgi:hypothetical protein